MTHTISVCYWRAIRECVIYESLVLVIKVPRAIYRLSPLSITSGDQSVHLTTSLNCSSQTIDSKRVVRSKYCRNTKLYLQQKLVETNNMMVGLLLLPFWNVRFWRKFLLWQSMRLFLNDYYKTVIAYTCLRVLLYRDSRNGYYTRAPSCLKVIYKLRRGLT